jgi:hypothetical protein
MDLFTIICTTCKSRLKVRDQGAIGQILACPKCGGMVMVKPPPAFHEASEQRSDVPTATELSSPSGPRFDQTLDSAAFDVVDELLSDAPPKFQQPPSATPPPAGPSSSPKPRFVGGPKPVRPSPAPAAEAGAIPPPPPEPAARVESTPAVAGHSRQWLLMAASVGLGVTLAFGAVTATVILLRGSRGPVRSTKPDVARPVKQPPDRDITEKAAPPTPPEAVTAQSPGHTSDQATRPAAAEVSPAQPPAQPPATSAAAATDPVGIVQPPATNDAQQPPATGELAKFDSLISGGSDDPLARPLVSPPATVSPEPESGPVRPLAPRPPSREVDVAKRLADALVSIETAGTPLADFVQLLSDLSTIPISLDLPLTPATADSPVVVKLVSTTVGTALDEALRPLRLEAIVADDQIVIRRIEPEHFAPFSYPVKDLTGGDESQMAELAELIRAIVEPEAWKEEAGGSLEVDSAKGNLIIKQRRAVQVQVLIALEKLRAARRPPLPHVYKALFQATTRYGGAAANLAKSVSFNFSQPTRLVTILERLSEATGMRIVVDWRDVASAGWNPAAEAKLLVNGKPLAETLDTLLDPLDLAWRVIDERTVQVVTPSRLHGQGEFELYPVAALVMASSSEAVLERIRTALAKALTDEVGGEVRYDESTKCVLAWLPQPHQQALELLLEQWKAEAAK